MSVVVDYQRLIDSGWHVCSACRGLVHPSRDKCGSCGTSTKTSAPTAPQPKARRRTVAPMTAANALGGLAGLTEHTLTVVAYGEPIPEGSTSAIATGVVAHANPALALWRRAVNKAAREAAGIGWEPVNGPVVLDAVFTLTRPASAPRTKAIHPATKPDIDKLVRAIGDALSPKDPAQRILAEDSRIVGTGVTWKTHPRPFHTHPDALDQPGVLVRLYPAPQPAPIPPSATGSTR